MKFTIIERETCNSTWSALTVQKGPQRTEANREAQKMKTRNDDPTHKKPC